MNVLTGFHFWRVSGIMVVLLLFAGLVCFGLTACDGSAEQDAAGQGAGQKQPPPPVAVMRAEASNVDVYRDYPARIHGARRVQVRARVAGILEKRRYDEGQVVEKGDVLFEIDAEPFEIAFRRATAEFDEAHAQYRHAEKQWLRYAALYEQNSISERERDLAETDYLLARARMERAAADRDDARRNLRYTTVQAPVAGITELEAVSEGNLIESGQLLTTITQLDSVHARFAIPEGDAMIQKTARAALSSGDGKAHRYDAVLIMPDGTEYTETGNLDFTASTINQETGSVTARAIFSNPDGMLIPGQFVRIRVLLETLPDVILIPEAAIGQGEEGTRVFVVDDEDVARARTVRTGPVVDGRQAILGGLDTGDKVVISGHLALRDGMAVSIEEAPEGPAGEETR